MFEVFTMRIYRIHAKFLLFGGFDKSGSRGFSSVRKNFGAAPKVYGEILFQLSIQKRFFEKPIKSTPESAEAFGVLSVKKT